MHFSDALFANKLLFLLYFLRIKMSRRSQMYRSIFFEQCNDKMLTPLVVVVALSIPLQSHMLVSDLSQTLLQASDGS